MKKLLALIVALMLALTCTSALATTVCTEVTIDRDLAKEMLPGFGVPEDQLGTIDAVLAVVNALGVRVTTVEDGAQVDLSLNDADALSLGWATDDAGASIVSTLFPNYILTIQNETIAQMMEQMSANMPGAGGEGMGGLDMAAMQEVLGKHFAKWMEACAAAGQPGEPVAVAFEYGDYTFDTMVPVTVDMAAVTAALTAGQLSGPSLSVTTTFFSTWGYIVMPCLSSDSVCLDSIMTSIILIAVSMPSPVFARRPKMIWPDCSPPIR